jgi:hypothetical protein
MAKDEVIHLTKLNLRDEIYTLPLNETMWPNTVDQLKFQIVIEKTGE